MFRVLLSIVAVFLVFNFFNNVSASIIDTYTNEALFLSDIASQDQVVYNFDSSTLYQEFESGVQDLETGLTFTYDIAEGEYITVVEDYADGGNQWLGLTSGDFWDGDSFDITFDSPVTSVGMRFYTSDEAIEDEIRLYVGAEYTGNSETYASFDVDNGYYYFIGLKSDTLFDTVSIDFLADGEVNFLYNLDDILTANEVPLPGAAWLLASGLLGVFGLRQRNC